jgi:hypothetical protein
MQVGSIRGDSDNFQHLVSDEPGAIEKCQSLYGSPLGTSWNPAKFKLATRGRRNKKLLETDFPGGFVGSLFLSARAAKCLAVELDGKGELLPIRCDAGRFFLFNVTNVTDVLNLRDSKLEYFGSGRLMDIREYQFSEELVKDETIFRLPYFEAQEHFVTDRFWTRVVECGLVGLDFRLRWTSPPDDPKAASLAQPAMTADPDSAIFGSWVTANINGDDDENPIWMIFEFYPDGTALISHAWPENGGIHKSHHELRYFGVDNGLLYIGVLDKKKRLKRDGVHAWELPIRIRGDKITYGNTSAKHTMRRIRTLDQLLK